MFFFKFLNRCDPFSFSFFIQAICLAQEKPSLPRPARAAIINKKGEEVKIRPPDYYNEVLNGPIITQGTGDKSILINDNLGKRIELDYYAREFSEGMAVVERCESEELRHVDWCGYIDQTGRLVIPMRYNWCDSFSEGLALVSKGGKAHTFYSGFGEKKDIRYGFIDKNGREVIKLGLAYASGFHDGLAVVTYFSRRELSGKDKSLYGYIDKTGKIVIKPNFIGARDFSDGLAAISTVKTESSKGGTRYYYFWGYIDKTGNVVIQPQFAGAREFHEGLAAVQIGNKWGYIDKSGQVVIQPRFRIAYDFHKGFADVELEEER